MNIMKLFNAFIFFCFLLFSMGLYSETVSESNESINRKKVEELERKVESLSERVAYLEDAFRAISGLKLSGYFDVYMSNQKNKPNIFQIGGLELDLIHRYNNNFNVAAAILVNEDTSLKTGFIDYTIYGQTVTARGNLLLERGIHLQVGKFDVPFGNDWEYFQSPSRITFTAPLTTEKIMDGGYSDTGIRLLAGFQAVNISAYVVRGIDKKESYGGNSYGFRFGLTPLNNPYLLSYDREKRFEAGFSYIYDVDSNGAKSEEAFALDFTLSCKYFFVRSEYLKRKNVMKVEENGAHATCGIRFSHIIEIPLVLYFRYGYYEIINDTTAGYDDAADNDELKDRLERFTLGLNVNISDISYIKFEYSINQSNDSRFINDEYFTEREADIQLVIKF